MSDLSGRRKAIDKRGKAMNVYWISWYSIEGAWGFPWHWRSGYAGDRVTIVALIAAESEAGAWSKAGWLTDVDERRFCHKKTEDWIERQDWQEGRFRREEWWPHPKTVWRHLDEGGWREEFWRALEGKP